MFETKDTSKWLKIPGGFVGLLFYSLQFSLYSSQGSPLMRLFNKNCSSHLFSHLLSGPVKNTSLFSSDNPKGSGISLPPLTCQEARPLWLFLLEKTGTPLWSVISRGASSVYICQATGYQDQSAWAKHIDQATGLPRSNGPAWPQCNPLACDVPCERKLDEVDDFRRPEGDNTLALIIFCLLVWALWYMSHTSYRWMLAVAVDVFKYFSLWTVYYAINCFWPFGCVSSTS